MTKSLIEESLVDQLVEQFNDEFNLGLDAPWARTNFATGIEPGEEQEARVDRNTRTIHGVSVVTKGMAEGHNLILDDQFLDQVVKAGNEAKAGIKARFDHPNASNTSMGTAVGRFKKFRRDGDVVRGDLSLLKTASKSPNGDFPSYLMDLAEEDSQAFGTSIVFEDNPIQQLDDEGKPLKDAPMISRLQRLFAADVVDDPAANPNGFFSTPRQKSFAQKLTSFLDRFLQSRGVTIAPATQPDKEPNMSNPKQTQADQNPTQQSTEQSVDIEALRKEERERVGSIMKYGHAFGCTTEMLQKLVDSGQTQSESLRAICDDAIERKFVAKSTVLHITDSEANPSSGGPQDTPAEDKKEPNLEEMTVEEYCKAKWEKEPNLREEFGEYEIYEAFVRNAPNTKILTSTKK